MPETTPILRCLTLDAHWAWAVREGMKAVENRKRGVKSAEGKTIAHEQTPGGWVLDVPFFLAVHAGMKWDADADFLPRCRDDLAFGHIGCIVRVRSWVDRRLADHGTLHKLAEQYGRWLEPVTARPVALDLTDLHKLERPVVATGAQGLWLPSADVRAEILAQLPVGHLLRGEA
mgnify:CR=1 FL=1